MTNKNAEIQFCCDGKLVVRDDTVLDGLFVSQIVCLLFDLPDFSKKIEGTSAPTGCLEIIIKLDKQCKTDQTALDRNVFFSGSNL